MRAVTVNAATYVKQDRTSVSITSKKTGWQKINGDYYFYNSKGRLICGSFKLHYTFIERKLSTGFWIIAIKFMFLNEFWLRY